MSGWDYSNAPTLARRTIQGLQAKKIGPWYLEEWDPQTIYEKREQNGETTYWKSEAWCLRLTRQFTGASALSCLNGTQQTTFAFKTGAQQDARINFTNILFVCTQDRQRIVEAKTGEGQQDQTWEYYSTPLQISETEFNAAGTHT